MDKSWLIFTPEQGTFLIRLLLAHFVFCIKNCTFDPHFYSLLFIQILIVLCTDIFYC